MVGDDDAVDAGVERAARVVGVQDALEQDRQLRALAQERQVVPRQLRPREDLGEALHGGAAAPALQVLQERAGIRARELHERAQRLRRGLRRRRLAVGRALRHQAAEHRVARVLRDALPAQEGEEGGLEVARAPADDRRVERQHDRLAAARLGARDEALDEVVRRAPVELEPARAVAQHLGALLHRDATPGWRRSSARPVSRAARATATSASRWASSSTPTGASRNGESSRRPNSSTDASGCAAPRSIRGTIRLAGEGGAVLAHGVLGAGAGLDVGEGVGGHRLAGRLLAAARGRAGRAGGARSPRRGRWPSGARVRSWGLTVPR